MINKNIKATLAFKISLSELCTVFCAYRHSMGLHQAVALCMNHCLAAEVGTNDGWFKTVILAGGTSCLPGLPGMLF